jgi:hypothetical protein
MLNKEKNYIILILLHIILGVVVFLLPEFSLVYGILIFFVGIFFVIKTRNRNNEVLYAAAYIVGSEVFLRMTDGVLLYEFGKYGVMIFLIIGMMYSGFSKNAIPYWIFLILLIPGIIIATDTLNFGTESRNRIIFNISGPVCLGISSLYTFNRKITIGEINNLLLLIGLPIISCAVYITLFVPELKQVLIGNGSNFKTSGGFGPNQVATILGLGMFVFFSRLFFASSTKLLFLINLILGLFITYRGLITFSRGGMITGLLMFLTLFVFVYYYSKNRQKLKLNFLFGFFVISFIGIFIFSEIQSGGLLSKRYNNQDAIGRKKTTLFSGREDIAEGEINSFLENPFFGIGVAKGFELRKEQTGELVASHDELTRMIAEHGLLGILALLILFITPFVLFLYNKQHLFLFCFLIFWLLSINHSAMRTAAPAFIYSLSLLKVRFDEN